MSGVVDVSGSAGNAMQSDEYHFGKELARIGPLHATHYLI